MNISTTSIMGIKVSPLVEFDTKLKISKFEGVRQVAQPLSPPCKSVVHSLHFDMNVKDFKGCRL